MALVSHDRLPGIIIPSDQDIYETSQVTSLMLAAYHGNIERVLSLLKENQQSIMSKNIFGQTAFDYAIDNGQISVIDILLAYNIDLYDIDSNGQNILHRCAQYGSMPKVETCLTIGINTDICNRDGDTALTIAARSGNLNIVKLLVNSGSDVSIRNNDGLNATDCAFCNNHEEVQAFLLASQELAIPHSLGCTMLEECRQGNIESVKSLIDAHGEAIVNFRDQSFQHYSPLHVACNAGHLALAQLLKQNRANINSRNHIFDTILMSSSIRNNMHIVEWLITQGVRMNNRNSFHESALFVAAIKGYFPMVKLLVENGILLNFHTTKNSTALHAAVQEQHFDILAYLLNKGALPDVTGYGGTPLRQAVILKNMVMVECLIKYGACVNQHDHNTNSPLTAAVTANSLYMVRYLIEKGADANITDKNGFSPKDIARSLGYYDIESYLTNITRFKVPLDATFNRNVPTAQDHLFQMCQTGKGTKNQFDSFIRGGADVNGINIDGRTPLIVATKNCSKNCVQWLLEKRVCVFTKDKESVTAIEYAVENEDKDLVALLLNASHESINTKQTKQVLESSTNRSIQFNSHTSTSITTMLLEHCGFSGNYISSLLKKCITFENVVIAEILFGYQLGSDLFDPSVVTISCMSSNLDILQHLVKYISDSKHRHFYFKLAVRLCLANQLHQALSTLTHELSSPEDIFWTSNQNFWCGFESEAFKLTMEFVVDKSLDINAQNISGWTFLMYAASMGMVEVVKFLLLKGADSCMVNKDEEDAIGIALKAGQYETAMLLTDEPLVASGILDAHIRITQKNL